MKLLVFVALIVAMSAQVALGFPTYTATQGGTGGTYGSTGIAAVYYDETGRQLFDGDYGMWDWIIRQQPSTLDQYWAHYEDQKGYAYPWVGWSSTPTITLDMGTIFSFSQIGVHSYNGREIHCPSSIDLEFSNDGTTSIASTTAYFGTFADDNVFWLNSDFSPVQARYVKINLIGSDWRFIDEVSINGMDGGNFVTPEPSGILALGTSVATLGILKRRRKG